jgi:hypothetical protein
MAKSPPVASLSVTLVKSSLETIEDAANSKAPPFPLTSRVIEPKDMAPLKKVAVMGSTSERSGWASKPKVSIGDDDSSSIVRLAAPLLQSTGRFVGVTPPAAQGVSVAGGQFHVPQLVGTVSLTTGVPNLTVKPPPEMKGYGFPSLSPLMSIRVVEAMYGAVGSEIHNMWPVQMLSARAGSAATNHISALVAVQLTTCFIMFVMLPPR